MSSKIIKTPFFVFNPKSYLYGESLKELAIVAEDLAKTHDISIFVTAPYTELKELSKELNYSVLCSQHLDGINPGRGMGFAFGESLKESGAKATFLNHAEHPLTLSELVKALAEARRLEMITIVCADSIQEAKAIAMLDPDIILCEPTELIGTGQTSDETYVLKTNEAIKAINPNILVMQAAGISTANDVFNVIKLGADGTGCTSGIVKAHNPKQMLIDMVEAAMKGRDN